jgi:hypothetical protein
MGSQPQIFMAEEGSLGERGLAPPLNFFPSFKQRNNRGSEINLFERGTGGE